MDQLNIEISFLKKIIEIYQQHKTALAIRKVVVAAPDLDV